MDMPLDPSDFFLWDDLIDPGKEHQCSNCGRLLDEDDVEWSDEYDCLVCCCPECGTMIAVEE